LTKGNTVTTATVSPTAALTVTPAKATVVRLVGYISILAAIIMIVAGGAVWGVVTSQLKAEEITVSEDADFMPGAAVEGPFSAYAQAAVINKHALAASDGKTYASFLRASLFTSVVSYGVAALVMGVGLLFGLIGYSLTAVVPSIKKNKA
jgi:hypothetical protein